MNLETEIDRGLWSVIRRSYESSAWSNAILDSIHYLSDTIRSKTGLQSDGAALAGQALGGKSPKLRLNRLETESETSFQMGVEQLLRGIYQAFRNPRSHGIATADAQADADAIILFVNHLLKIVGIAKTEFSLDTCVQRVLDEDFVPSARYAELIVSEIPSRQRLNAAVSVYQGKNAGEGKKLRYFFDGLIPLLSHGERAEFFAVVSSELREINTDNEIRVVLQCLQPTHWPEIDEIARLRIEHRLVKEMQDGRYEPTTKRCPSGALATWARTFFPFFTLQEQAYQALVNKLWSGSRDQQDYVFEYFFSSLNLLREEPTSSLDGAICQGLDAGDTRFYNPTSYSWPWKDKPLSARVQKALDAYRQRMPADDDKEVPF